MCTKKRKCRTKSEAVGQPEQVSRGKERVVEEGKRKESVLVLETL